jgi:hypothetical protein
VANIFCNTVPACEREERHHWSCDVTGALHCDWTVLMGSLSCYHDLLTSYGSREIPSTQPSPFHKRLQCFCVSLPQRKLQVFVFKIWASSPGVLGCVKWGYDSYSVCGSLCNDDSRFRTVVAETTTNARARHCTWCWASLPTLSFCPSKILQEIKIC